MTMTSEAGRTFLVARAKGATFAVTVGVETHKAGEHPRFTVDHQPTMWWNRISVVGEWRYHQRAQCIGARVESVWEDFLLWTKDHDATIRWAVDWDEAKLTRVFEFAGKWHLNDMRSACSHQTPHLVTRPNGRALFLDAPACEVSGYRYGSAWLIKLVDKECRRAMKELFGWEVV